MLTKEAAGAMLKSVLANMTVPEERAKLRDDQDIHWLRRNLVLQNRDHPRLDDARLLLKALGARMMM